MTVYVDDMLREATLGRWPAKWSHLFADTPEELMQFAARLGMSMAWLQHAGSHREHFDVPKGKRDQALRLGAEPIAYPSGVAGLIERRRRVCQCDSLANCSWGGLVSQGGTDSESEGHAGATAPHRHSH